MKSSLIILLVIIISIFFSTAGFTAGKKQGRNLIITPDSVINLEKVQKIALEQNPSMAIAKARTVQAMQRVTQAYAAYYPKIDLNATGSRNWRSDKYASTLYPENNPENIFSSNISGSWILFNGFARKFTKIAEKYGETESRLSDKNAQRLLLYAVASAYFNGQLAAANKVIAEADVAFNCRQVDNALAKKRVGAGSLSDVLNFKIQMNAAKTNLIVAQREYRSAIIGLMTLLDITDPKIIYTVHLARLNPEKKIGISLPDLQLLIKTAINKRPDIQEAQYALKRTKALVKHSYSKFYPIINLSGAVEGQRKKNMEFKSDDFGSFIAASFKFNLFEGGNTLAGVRHAKAKKEEFKNIFKETKNSVIKEVINAFEFLKSAQKALKMEQATQKLVMDNRNLVEREYQAGQTSLVRLNEAQRDLIRADSRLALSLVSVYRADTDIQTATGEILTPFNK